MKIFKNVIFAVVAGLLLVSYSSNAGRGDGSSGSGNETGGFGQDESSSTFGSGTSFGSYSTLSSHEEPPGDPGVPPEEGGPTPIPFDGGASILIASGVALGARKLYKGYKNTHE